MCLKAGAQPDIKHSIYFKDKHCNEFLFHGGICAMGHSNLNKYALVNRSVPNFDRECFFYKLNAQWDTVWSRRIGGSEEDMLYKMNELPNGNILLSGHTRSNDGDVWYGHNYSAGEIWMVEIDTMGTIIKGKTFGGGNGSELNEVIISSDGYIYLAGSTIANDYDFACLNYGSLDPSAWVAKYDTAFNKVWINMYVGNDGDGWATIKEINPNRLVVGYQTNSTSFESDPGNAKGGNDLLVLYIDSNGTTLWKKRYGSSDDEGSRRCVVDTQSKTIYFVGMSWAFPGTGGIGIPSGDITYKSGTAWIHIIDTLGNIKASKAYGAATKSTYIDDAKWYNGSLYVFGESQGGGGDMDMPVGVNVGENAWIGIIDSNANLVGKKTLTIDGSVYIYNSFIYNSDLYINTRMGTYTNPYKCDTSNLTQTFFNLGKAPLSISETEQSLIEFFTMSPNPGNQQLLIELSNKYKEHKGDLRIFTLEGKLIYSHSINNSIMIDCSQWPKGEYIVEVSLNNSKKQTKLFTKI